MAKKEQKVYMPLMIGDWLKGTRGMKAEIRGVYLNLLLFQWDNGFIPSDMEELCLIDPELPKVWDKLKAKFIEVEPGKLQNRKNEEVRDFWKKQKKNGGKGGRPKKDNPDVNPTNNPNTNPKGNHHNDLDLDSDSQDKKEPVVAASDTVVNVPRETIDERLKDGLDELWIDKQRMNWRYIDFDLELLAFVEKVRGSPDHYATHNSEGFKQAFLYQLKGAKKKQHGQSFSKNDRTQQNINDVAGIEYHIRSGEDAGN